MTVYVVRVTYIQTFEHAVRADDEENAKAIAEALDHQGDGDMHLYDTQVAYELGDHVVADND